MNMESAGPVSEVAQPVNPSSHLISEDLRPVNAWERKFTRWDYLALWVGLVVNIPAYYLAGDLVDLGWSWWAALLLVFSAGVFNALLMVSSGIPGTKYGIPSPVFLRASLGIRGAYIATVVRSIILCGWFGIHTWVGADSISSLIVKVAPSLGNLVPLPVVGITIVQLLAYISFWLLQVLIFANGMDSIRYIERLAAPMLILLAIALMAWAISTAKGIGSILSKPSAFGPGMPREGEFWKSFWPGFGGVMGGWSTFAITIPDLTRYSKSQNAQILGQSIALPTVMTSYSLMGIIVTSATTVVFGEVITSPIEVLLKMRGMWMAIFGLIGIVLATISTNLPANVVGPANTFVSLAPRWITFLHGVVVTTIIGTLIMPWKIISSTDMFFTWITGASAALTPVVGIYLADYYVIHHGHLNIDDLYSTKPTGQYWFQGGYNIVGLVTWVLGFLPIIPGFLHAAGVVENVPYGWRVLYHTNPVACLVIAFFLYIVLIKIFKRKTLLPVSVPLLSAT